MPADLFTHKLSSRAREMEPGSLARLTQYAVNDVCGGIPNGRKLKAVVPGGSSSAVLTADEVDAGIDFDSMKAQDDGRVGRHHGDG